VFAQILFLLLKVFAFIVTKYPMVDKASTIIQFTHNGQESAQLPAIWFLPNSHKLHIQFSNSIFRYRRGFHQRNNATTQIQINAVGLQVEVLLNGTVSHYMELSGARTAGNAVVHVLNP
jgi:hypothetical protein